MNWFTAIVTYLTLWWLVLFCVLPFGIRSQAEAGEIVEGSDPGAPAFANMKKKVIITTIITAIVWGILAYVLMSGMISLDRPFG
jgi:predicted secreted protein